MPTALLTHSAGVLDTTVRHLNTYMCTICKPPCRRPADAGHIRRAMHEGKEAAGSHAEDGFVPAGFFLSRLSASLPAYRGRKLIPTYISSAVALPASSALLSIRTACVSRSMQTGWLVRYGTVRSVGS